MFNFSRQEIILAGVFLVLGFLLVFFPSEKDSSQEVVPLDTGEENPYPSEEGKGKKLMVHVSGAVISPGVYSFREGERIVDALKTAGGASWNADLDGVNLAAPLVDGMQVVIPCRQEQEGSVAREENNGQININRAGSKELQQLPNIGPARAEAIIEFREKQGRFEGPEDLLEIPGIGDKTLERLREHVRFY